MIRQLADLITPAFSKVRIRIFRTNETQGKFENVGPGRNREPLAGFPVPATGFLLCVLCASCSEGEFLSQGQLGWGCGAL